MHFPKVNAGFSLVAEEMRAPINKEFQRVFEEQNLGVSLEDSLDNMTDGQLRAAVALCRAAGVRTEASGGLTIDRARSVADTGVDYLSVGGLTHSAPVLDLGLDLVVSDRAG